MYDSELEALMNNLMDIVNGCNAYCDDCNFYQNVETCSSC